MRKARFWIRSSWDDKELNVNDLSDVLTSWATEKDSRQTKSVSLYLYSHHQHSTTSRNKQPVIKGKLTITRLSHDLLIRFSRITDNYHQLGLVAEADNTDWGLPYHAKIESKNNISSQTLQCLETFPVALRG